MPRFQTMLFGVLITFAGVLSAAEGPSPLNGHWLVKSLEADARVAARQGTNDDLLDSTVLMGMTMGVIAAHRENNMMVTLIYAGVESAHKKAPDKNPPPTDSPQLRVAFAFAPLLGLPDTMQYPQILAILRRYLAANPERWGEMAYSLIVAALQDSIKRNAMTTR